MVCLVFNFFEIGMVCLVLEFFGTFGIGRWVLELTQSHKQLCSGIPNFVEFCHFLELSPC